jgi:hypothetical protein
MDSSVFLAWLPTPSHLTSWNRAPPFSIQNVHCCGVARNPPRIDDKWGEGRIQEDEQLNRPFEAASKYAQSGVPGRLTVHMKILEKLLAKVVADFEISDPPSAVAEVTGQQ